MTILPVAKPAPGASPGGVPSALAGLVTRHVNKMHPHRLTTWAGAMFNFIKGGFYEFTDQTKM